VPEVGVVRDVGAGGDGVVETPHGIVFVRGALPGDEVRLGRVKKSGKVRRAEVLEVVKPSAERRQPPCPIQARCGGCPWMAWREDAQRARKARFVAEALRLDEVPIAHAESLRYRTRARLAWHGRARGYHAPRSKRIVDVKACAVHAEPLAAAWALVRELPLEDRGTIDLALSGDGCLVSLETASPQPPALYAALEALEVRGVMLAVEGGTPARFGDTDKILQGVDGAPLKSAAFAQAHGALNDELVRYAAGAVRGPRVLELFAGSGNLSVLLPDAELVAVERDGEAVAALRENLRARRRKAKIVEVDAADFPAGRFDTVLLDPPRVGAAAAVARLAGTRASRIVYVSCNPRTLGRDVRALGDAGYAVTEAKAFDMFPQTPHVEAVAILDAT